jgi:hypothetical protein
MILKTTQPNNSTDWIQTLSPFNRQFSGDSGERKNGEGR